MFNSSCSFGPPWVEEIAGTESYSVNLGAEGSSTFTRFSFRFYGSLKRVLVYILMV